METPSPRPRFRWKLLCLVLSIPAILILTAWLWVNSVANRRWAQMEARTQELAAEWERRDISREVLRGEPLEGNGWDDYLQAAARIKAVSAAARRPLPGDKSPSGRIEDYVAGLPSVDVAVIRQAVADRMPALDDFRRGVRRKGARFHFPWSKVPDDPALPIPSLVGTTQVSNLALAKARLLSGENRPREAMELQLEVVRYGQDIARDGVPLAQSLGFQIVRKGLDAVQETLALGLLSIDDLQETIRELEILERTMPPANGLIQERIYLGVILERLETWEMAKAYGGMSWRHAFSPRLLLSAQADLLDRHAHLLLQAEGRGWKAVQGELDLFRLEVGSAKSPTLDVYLQATGGLERAVTLRTRLILLKAGAQWKRGGDKLQIQDGFGSMILMQENDQGIKIWSVGPDGVNDGGKGDWKSGPDIVLQLSK